MTFISGITPMEATGIKSDIVVQRLWKNSKISEIQWIAETVQENDQIKKFLTNLKLTCSSQH